MTLGTGGPAASHHGGSAPDDTVARPRRSRPSRPARGPRSTLALARIEAFLLVRSALVLGGLVAGAATVWLATENVQPVWWIADWRIGYGQQVLSMTVLVAAQLATGRARRDHLRDLYASFPTPTGTCTRAQLLAILAALAPALLLVGAAAAAFGLRGAVGAPSPAVLAGGLLLVLVGGAVGVAVGTRFPHPLAGILAALISFVAFGQSNQFNSAAAWLFPWQNAGGIGQLPAPLPGYPPAVAHAVELAGIAALAGAVALAATAGHRRQLAAPLAAAVLAVVLVCLAGAAQLRPVPTSALDRLAEQVADPSTAQHCTTAGQVRYCLFPRFGSALPVLRSPVDAVLAHVPAPPARSLTVQQVALVSFEDPNLTYGHTRQQIAGWVARTRTAPGTVAAATAIYLPVGSWPAGSRLADARFDVALGAAEWAVGLPTASGQAPTAGPENPQCVPLHQAREAVAIWLAILATHRDATALQSGLPGRGRQGSYALVAGSPVATWTYPGEYADYIASPGPQVTADGFVLARAMAALPIQRVQQVLTQGWDRWLDPHTTDAALAAALGIPQPTFPDPLGIPAPSQGPSQPVCQA